MAYHPSRVQLARQKTLVGKMWQNYHARFVRTGSFFPIVHAVSALAGLQLVVWAVRGMPEESRPLLEGNSTPMKK